VHLDISPSHETQNLIRNKKTLVVKIPAFFLAFVKKILYLCMVVPLVPHSLLFAEVFAERTEKGELSGRST
jgi:hypothetical protein